jgi:hypothetical protein
MTELGNSPITSSLPPCTTSLRKPISFASVALNRRPANASSRALESSPVILGKRCKDPISDAAPNCHFLNLFLSIQGGDLRSTDGNCESGVRSSQADIASASYVNGNTQSQAEHSSDDRLCALRKGFDGSLKVLPCVSLDN